MDTRSPGADVTWLAPASVALRPVTLANRGDLDDIDPGHPMRTWVHANWYWHQQSLEHPAVTFRMIHLAGVEPAVGMVAFGPAYEDVELTRPIAGEYEIIHLVLDARYQRRGIGSVVARAALQILLAIPGCTRVVVAINPANAASARFFATLGFEPIERVNYDGDPMLGRHEAVGAAAPDVATT
jgi:RimJ/RimL family protein N-acetyltransferase